jgi:nucleoside 2-deoxyribosyltransferase
MTAKVRIYLAGPLGFSEGGRHFYNTVLIPHVRRLGCEVLDPWALTDARPIRRVQAMPYGRARREAWRRLNLRMGATNRAAIDAAQGVVAVLDGTDVDSGTAAEIGYAFARGKRIVGYRGDFRLSADNEGSTVNLQVEYFIRASGGTIVERYQDLGRALALAMRADRPATRRAASRSRASRATRRRLGGRRRVR